MAQKNNKKGKRVPAYSTDTMVVCLIVGLLLIALGVLIFLATAVGMAGDVFDGFRTFSKGMCGALAVVLPVIPVWGGVLVMISTQKKPPIRPFLLGCVLMVLLCTAATLLTFVGSDALMDYTRSYIAGMGGQDVMASYLTRAFDFGSRYGIGGGLIGMLLSWPLWKAFGAIAGAVTAIIAAIVTFLFLIRLEDMQIRKVSGLDAETIMVGAMGSKYAINIEWNTDELIIGTQDGIKTYEFAAGE